MKYDELVRRSSSIRAPKVKKSPEALAAKNYIYYGWPLSAGEQYDLCFMATDFRVFGPHMTYYRTHVIVDSVLAVFILLMTWFMCEWLIRRRAVRRDA